MQQSNDQDAGGAAAADSDQAEETKIWSAIALMDYLLRDLGEISPMSAHLIRMARQNLLDEFLPERMRPPRHDL